MFEASARHWIDTIDLPFSVPLPPDAGRFRGREMREDWNQLYRAALAQASIQGSAIGTGEVARGREQGRLVRNPGLPLSLAVLALQRQAPPFLGSLRWCVAAISGFVFSVLLYASATYFNFAEASLQLKLAASRKVEAN